ncbi:CDP-alcohol phosphatidyltransferase family protein [Oharaeibacter diazotrophicus]|uniref:Phosphatidylcholine synthase n=1 Tax=Oharaeibacter diazotrophicus TaxID=1920512 RepID=A0A4V3CWL7_9HYPH|nr:CDP-alcohol phosphatidyltransferase family protein [Oharaeibacter diazotrophicus]TDP86848.1 phosphatidylcholine synthase [Oharaeibacter diazotrophicus]BBE71209.1 phosphatidylcholine synthase [Pleomorphomonas sp. SM30]GLS77964.1 phosphatidylcholine synthase [Oharaeibacter diazotrophicus]
MAQLTLVEKHQNTAIALAVHAFTASGVVLAMLAAFAAYQRNWTEFFGWLGVALFVDGVDGPIARRFAVERRLPTFSGASLDFVVDYVTYVFLPAFAIVTAGFTSTPIALVLAGIIVFTSAMYFADTRMKMKNNAFRGFPAVWNGVVFVFFVFQPPAWFVIAVVVALAVLTFMPVAFVHPVRVERWRPLTLAVTAAWFVFASAALAFRLDPPDAVKIGFALTSAYLSTVAAVQQILERLKL